VRTRRIILKRLAAGERGRHVASALHLAPQIVYQVAHRYGIQLKRGNPALSTPEAIRARFDKRHWPGAGASLLKRADEAGFTEAAKAFGKSRQWAHQQYYRLGGKKAQRGRKKPPLLRPDVSPEKISELAKRCRNADEIAATLRCSVATIRQRARMGRIRLPVKPPRLTRPDLTAANVQGAARSTRSIREIARRLRTCYMTISDRARAHKIILPDGRVKITRAQIDRIRQYTRLGCTLNEIAARLKRDKRTIAGWNRRYRLGIPVRHYRRLTSLTPMNASDYIG
jgi:transposase